MSPKLVSIHAPARGATQNDTARLIINFCFNPRTRTGCDLRIALNLRFANDVSIHAPARGATCPKARQATLSRCFNPRTRTGCDTHNRNVPGNCWRFNPRTRTGCDLTSSCFISSSIVSIHAPARGATQIKIKPFFGRIVSIHAPARGATRLPVMCGIV